MSKGLFAKLNDLKKQPQKTVKAPAKPAVKEVKKATS